MKRLFLIVGLAVLLSGCSLPFIGKKQAALQIDASPGASVYLNDKHVGQTPYYDEKLKAGEYSIKIAVDNDPTKEWQTTLNLSPKLMTVIQKNFGPNPDESSSYILQLEPLVSKTSTELSIVTMPDNVIVKIDGQPQGFSPVALDAVTSGDHVIVLAAPGHQELTIKAKAKEGYKLILSAQLAKTPALEAPPVPESSPSATLTVDPTPKPKAGASPSPAPRTTTATPIASASATPARPYVEIIETGTGWLRVRSEPDSYADNEVAKLDIGAKVPWIEVNESGWYKVEYLPGKQGWISAKYATLYK